VDRLCHRMMRCYMLPRYTCYASRKCCYWNIRVTYINEHCTWSCIFYDIRNLSDSLMLWPISTRIPLILCAYKSIMYIDLKFVSFLDEEFIQIFWSSFWQIMTIVSLSISCHVSSLFIRMLIELMYNISIIDNFAWRSTIILS